MIKKYSTKASSEKQALLLELIEDVNARVANKAKDPADTPLTEGEAKLIDTAVAISNAQPLGHDLAFTHSVFCHVGLPRRKVEGREFMRQSGAAWINIQAGWLDEGSGPVAQMLPYGALPRLTLAWVSSYAKRHNTREVPIGRSVNEFLKMMQIAPDGRVYNRLRGQLHALAACRLQIGFRGRTYNGQPIEQFDAWLQRDNVHQPSLWPGVMLLSEPYFNELQLSAVPLDNRALHALKGSALALDIYCWLAHRLHRIEGNGLMIHWKALKEQFGQEYQGKDADKDFKKKFLVALKKVKTVYPESNVDKVSGGLVLNASPPPVSPKMIGFA